MMNMQKTLFAAEKREHTLRGLLVVPFFPTLTHVHKFDKNNECLDK